MFASSNNTMRPHVHIATIQLCSVRVLRMGDMCAKCVIYGSCACVRLLLAGRYTGPAVSKWAQCTMGQKF